MIHCSLPTTLRPLSDRALSARDCSIFSREAPYQIGPRVLHSRGQTERRAPASDSRIYPRLIVFYLRIELAVHDKERRFVVWRNRVIWRRREKVFPFRAKERDENRSIRRAAGSTWRWIRWKVRATNFVSHRMPKATTRAHRRRSLFLSLQGCLETTNHLLPQAPADCSCSRLARKYLGVIVRMILQTAASTVASCLAAMRRDHMWTDYSRKHVMLDH